MKAISDADLWRRASRDDTDAFAELFDRHADSVYAFCFRRTADWGLAEDLTSVTFLEAWRRRRVRLRSSSVLPWLLGIATNVVRNQHRAKRRYADLLGRLPSLEPSRDFADDLAERLDAERAMGAVLALVRRLPRHEQDVLALCVWQGLDTRDAASALGVREPTVRTRLFRARRRLKALAAASSGVHSLPMDGVYER